MGVFDLIRAMFGLDSSETIQRTDRSASPDSDDESTRTEPTTSEPDEAVAAGTDATASTGSMTETPSEDPETAAEPAEAGAGVTEHTGTETPAAETAEATGPVPDEPEAEIEADAGSDGETEPDDEATGDAAPDAPPAGESSDDPVDSINGIGQAYAGRLAEADIETVGELLEADAAELAGRTDLSEKRIRRWQKKADER